jgi:hypothetical protein
MTPRQLVSWLNLARRQRRSDLADLLAVTALGSRGEPEEVRRQLKAWQQE